MRALHWFVSRVRERGAAAVETAIVMSFLLVLAIGISETAYLIVNQLAVGNASREGARAASSVGTESAADDVVIDIVEQALCSMVAGEATKVLIFNPTASGGVPGHTPSDSDYSSYDNTKVVEYVASGTRSCSNGNTVPTFSYSNGDWTHDVRQNQLPTLDDIGVLVLYDHTDITSFLPFFERDDLVEVTVMRLEPDLQES